MLAGSKPAVFVLVPVHNRREITRKFIACLTKQTYSPLQIIVIDDGSSDGTADMVRQDAPNAHVIRGDGTFSVGDESLEVSPPPTPTAVPIRRSYRMRVSSILVIRVYHKTCNNDWMSLTSPPRYGLLTPPRSVTVCVWLKV